MMALVASQRIIELESFFLYIYNATKLPFREKTKFRMLKKVRRGLSSVVSTAATIRIFLTFLYAVSIIHNSLSLTHSRLTCENKPLL